MNELFVNVKVDREERPDVDAHDDGRLRDDDRAGRLADDGLPDARRAARSTQARTSRPSRATGCRASVSSCRRSRRRGASGADDLEAQAERLVAALGGTARLDAGRRRAHAPRCSTRPSAASPATTSPPSAASARAPKFPPASALELLLRRGGPEALGMVRRTLDGMAAGGLYDVVGGGFHRYSVDARWLVPHFEKMLYDNALLVSAYLHAWVVTGEERDRRVVEETVAYLLREMRLASGGLASAQDADTEGVEGADVHVDAGGVGGARPRAVAPRAVRARPLASSAASSTPEVKARLLELRDEAPAAVSRRQGDRLVERPRARGARGGGPAARPRRLARGRGRRSASFCSPSCAATTVACSAACATGA